MKQLKKVNNSDLSFRLKLNYNNVYSRLRMLLNEDANIFADPKIMSAVTNWYADDEGEYQSLADAPKSESEEIMKALAANLRKVKKVLGDSRELAPYSSEILEVPDDSYIFYRKRSDGGYKFFLTGWGCRRSHTPISETEGVIRFALNLPEPEPGKSDRDTAGYTSNTSSNIPGGASDRVPENVSTDTPASSGERSQTSTSSAEGAGLTPPPAPSPVTPPPPPVTPPPPPGPAHETNGENDPQEGLNQDAEKKKRVQHVVLKVLNQHSAPVEYEEVRIATPLGMLTGSTDDKGLVDVGNLQCHSSFRVVFPALPEIPERAFEVEPKVEVYEMHIKKYVHYSPVLFVEDQNGNMAENYSVKVVVSGQEYVMDTGTSGMVQLPTMREGQKFIVIEASNYANEAEYEVTPETVKTPFLFTIQKAMKPKVGITVLDKTGKPIEGATVTIPFEPNQLQQTTDKEGRAEFPAELFQPGPVDVKIYIKGKGNLNTRFDYTPDNMEYTVQLKNSKTPKSKSKFNRKWLMLIPLFLLLGFGGKYAYDKFLGSKYPTISEMETGVGLIIAQGCFYVDLNLPDLNLGGNPLVAYFNYDNEKGEITSFTYDPKEVKLGEWQGTGFLISDDGLIATNRHVVDPTPPEKIELSLKDYFQKKKDKHQQAVDNINNQLRMVDPGRMEEEGFRQAYAALNDSIKGLQEQIRFLDRIINVGNYEVKSFVKLGVAFTDTRLESYEDLIPCSNALAVGEPAGIDGNDLAIIKIKKRQDIPQNAFVFTIPEVDIMDGEIPDNYEVTVLGYHAGVSLQNLNKQEGLKPQAQHGKITGRGETYRVSYDAPTLVGSSGSPVLNNKGELVAINNSGLAAAGNFNWGIRTKYLKELLEKIRNNNPKNNNNKNNNK